MVSSRLCLVSKHDPDSYLPQSLSAESGKWWRPPYYDVSLEMVLCFCGMHHSVFGIYSPEARGRYSYLPTQL